MESKFIEEQVMEVVDLWGATRFVRQLCWKIGKVGSLVGRVMKLTSLPMLVC